MPDVYDRLASAGIDNGVLTVTTKGIYGFCNGDEVRLINKAGNQDVTVEVKDDYTFTVKDWTFATNDIFVYGKKANDFLTVDYDRIYTLNVSATQ